MARGLQPRVSLLGRVSLETDGRAVDEARFPVWQGRLLFAYLVAERGRAVPRDEWREALWGEAPPPTWDKALTGIVSRLRALLAEQGIDGGSALTGAFGRYRLELPEGTWVDVLAAATAADEASAALAAGDIDRASSDAVLTESLLREPFLPGEEGPWVEEKRRDSRTSAAARWRFDRRIPAFQGCAGGGELGRAGDRPRAVPRIRLPAPDGGPCGGGQPRGGAQGVRALPTPARGRTRRLPVARDRVVVPRALEAPSVPVGVATELRTPPDADPPAASTRAPESVVASPPAQPCRREPERVRAGRASLCCARGGSTLVAGGISALVLAVAGPARGRQRASEGSALRRLGLSVMTSIDPSTGRPTARFRSKGRPPRRLRPRLGLGDDESGRDLEDRPEDEDRPADDRDG